MQGSKLKSLGRGYLRFIRYVAGGFMAVIGGLMVTTGDPAYLRPFGLFFMLAGLLLLPPIASRIGKRWPKLSPWYVSPMLAALSLFLGLVSSLIGIAAWERAHPEIVAKREAERKARADAASDQRVAGHKLPPMLKGLNRETMLGQARAELRDGRPEQALTIIYDNAPAEMLRTDGEVKTLVAQVEARIRANDAATEHNAFAEKVRGYWLPQLAGMTSTPPASASDIWNAVAKLENATRALEESSAMPLEAEGRQAQRELRTAIAAKQRTLFPILRGAYGKVVGQALWERDIDIRVGGAGNRSITWTGGLFVARANIARGQTEAQTHLLRLRFTHSTYEWVKGVGQRYTYTIDAPADDAVGYWDGEVFKPVR